MLASQGLIKESTISTGERGRLHEQTVTVDMPTLDTALDALSFVEQAELISRYSSP